MPDAALLRAGAPLGGDVTRSGLRPATAFLVGLAHLALIGAAVIVLPARIVAPRPEPALAVVFQPPEPPAPPQILASFTWRAPSVNEAAALSPVPPLRLQGDTRVLAPRPVRHQDAPRPVQAAPPAASVPQPVVTRPVAAQVQQPPHASTRALDAWEAQVHQAVQDALVYPNAARLMHREGRTRVRFDYGNGSVSGVSVAETSGSAALDEAALAAVSRAAIPPPPPELAGQARSLILWVHFSLAAANG